MTAKARTCSICRKPRSETHAPFCSKACKDRDLVQWFSDGYAVPAEAVEPEQIVREESD